jgi:hypothetical protein
MFAYEVFPALIYTKSKLTSIESPADAEAFSPRYARRVDNSESFSYILPN